MMATATGRETRKTIHRMIEITVTTLTVEMEIHAIRMLAAVAATAIGGQEMAPRIAAIAPGAAEEMINRSVERMTEGIGTRTIEVKIRTSGVAAETKTRMP